MHKTHAMAATVLGGVLMATSAFAQQANTQDQARTTGNGTATGVVNCPAGCVPATGARAALTPAQQRRRAEAVRAMRERRAAREQAEREREQQLSQLQSERSGFEQRLESERAARARAERERADAETELSRERAEHERLEREINERARLAALARTQPRVVSRGGGPRYRPHLTLGVEGGVGGFGEDVHRATWVGGAWGARVGVDFFNWLGVEGRYFGAYNDGYNPVAGQGIGLLTNGGSAVLRLTAPIPFVQPYAFGGVGGYHTSVVARDGGSTQNTPLRSTSYVAIPVGLGVNIPITHWMSIAAEGTYHGMLRESFSNDPTLSQGELWTGTGVLRFRL